MAEPIIHPSSVVEDGAVIGEDCRIGPFCHVGGGVVLGAGCRLESHAVVSGDTRMGIGCRIFPFASIGHQPQDLKYAGEPVQLVIGDRCTFREGVTVNPGTAGDRAITTIGSDGTFLANAHIAHDCTVGDHVILSNNVMIAGHCQIGDHVIMGGGAACHQFSRIGSLAFVGGLAAVENDVVPYGIALGNRAYLGGVNVVGMRRAGLDKKAVNSVRAAFRALFDRTKPIADNIEALRKGDLSPEVSRILEFVSVGNGRALCVPKD